MKLCSIEACDRQVDARGMCSTHYRRLRLYGDPLGGGAFRARPGEPMAFLLAAVGHKGDDCLIWPFARNSAGYAHLQFEGVDTLAHRIVCEAVNGPAPADKPESAHNCGKGSSGCVNGSHLEWKDCLENAADMVMHGKSQRGQKMWMSKLDENDVLEIMQHKGLRLAKDVAPEFGVTAANIVAIWRGTSWAWLTGASPSPTQTRENRLRSNGPFLTIGEVIVIKTLLGKKTPIEIAKTYQVSASTIRRILNGTSWAHINPREAA